MFSADLVFSEQLYVTACIYTEKKGLLLGWIGISLSIFLHNNKELAILREP